MKAEVVPEPSIKAEAVPEPSKTAEYVATHSRKAEAIPEPSRKSEVVPKPSRKAEVVTEPSKKTEHAATPSRKVEAISESSNKADDVPETSMKIESVPEPIKTVKPVPEPSNTEKPDFSMKKESEYKQPIEDTKPKPAETVLETRKELAAKDLIKCVSSGEKNIDETKQTTKRRISVENEEKNVDQNILKKDSVPIIIEPDLKDSGKSSSSSSSSSLASSSSSAVSATKITEETNIPIVIETKETSENETKQFKTKLIKKKKKKTKTNANTTQEDEIINFQELESPSFDIKPSEEKEVKYTVSEPNDEETQQNVDIKTYTFNEPKEVTEKESTIEIIDLGETEDNVPAMPVPESDVNLRHVLVEERVVETPEREKVELKASKPNKKLQEISQIETVDLKPLKPKAKESTEIVIQKTDELSKKQNKEVALDAWNSKNKLTLNIFLYILKFLNI